MGSSMSEAQEDLIVRHFNVACILLDGDEAGQQGANRLFSASRPADVGVGPGASGREAADLLITEEIQALLQEIGSFGAWFRLAVFLGKCRYLTLAGGMVFGSKTSFSKVRRERSTFHKRSIFGNGSESKMVH
jgi:hypothetical protein